MCCALVASNLYFVRTLKKYCVGSNAHWRMPFCHLAEELEEEPLSSEWYRAAYAKMIRLTHVLKDVETIDGRIVSISGDLIVEDCRVISHMKTFNSLAKIFIGTRSMQHALKKSSPFRPFSSPNEKNSITLNSLTKVCDFLNISAQQRQSVRLNICPQVTQHHVWKGSLEEVLKDLKLEMDSLASDSPNFQMAKQILSSCFRFFQDTTEVSTAVSPSWMRPTPIKKGEHPIHSRKWEEVLEIFKDLSKCLEREERLAYHVSKLEAMKEGLYHIKDLLVERDISYKEMQRQDCLVQKKLTKSLGHSSKCLFMLLLYYLHGSVRDIEVEVYGGLYSSEGMFHLCIGKIVTSCHEEAIWNAIKQLNKGLGVFQFVWQTAAKNGILKLQGHLWCLGAEERTLTYRGNVFHVHNLRL